MWCCPPSLVSCGHTGECHLTNDCSVLFFLSVALSPPVFSPFLLPLLSFGVRALNTAIKGPSILSRHPVIILIKCNYQPSEDNWVLLTALFVLSLVPASFPIPSLRPAHPYTHIHNAHRQQLSWAKRTRVKSLKGRQACGLERTDGSGTENTHCTVHDPPTPFQSWGHLRGGVAAWGGWVVFEVLRGTCLWLACLGPAQSVF